MYRILIMALVGLFACSFAFGQQDSLKLTFRQLSSEDIVFVEEEETQQILSGSRSLKQVTDLPFTIYVVTKEEIQKYGYVTLVDVLRSIPGIRVSQPGTGLDGETFLMRGLYGNTYAKILINDLPIRPTATRSMPISAQLMVQHAERIEISFGPSVGIYGADATAGVINIITTDTERPFYVQADASLGLDHYSNLSVMLGGKLGRDENIVKFSIFGNHTAMDDRRIIYDEDELYNTSNYFDDPSVYLSIPNYRGDATNIATRDLPTRSESIGFRVKYRDWSINYLQMERQDHSSISLNPAHQAYSNPANFLGERIERYSGNWEKEFNEKWSARTDLTFLRYNLDSESSSTFVLNPLNKGVLTFKDNSFLTDQQVSDFSQSLYLRYLSGSRFSASNSSDFYIDPLVTFSALPWLDLALGANVLIAQNDPFFDYSPFPYSADDETRDRRIGIEINQIIPERVNFNNTGIYFQQYATFDKLNIVSALRFDRHSRFGNNWSGRIAGAYSFTESLSATASYNRAFQYPSTYHEGTSLAVLTTRDSSWYTFASNVVEQNWQPETVSSYEIGLRGGNSSTFQTGITYFWTRANSLVAYNTSTIVTDTLKYITGYFQDPNSTMVFRGWQGRLRVSFGDNTDGYFNFQYASGRETLPFDGGELETVRGVPRWSWQLRLSTKLHRKWFLQTIYTRARDWTSRKLSDASFLEDESLAAEYTTERYGVLDITLRYQLSKAFQGHISAFNVLNAQYGGIIHNTSANSLRYNPQSLRIFRAGLNYRLQ